MKETKKFQKMADLFVYDVDGEDTEAVVVLDGSRWTVLVKGAL
jgi:hypothetical protein